MIASKSSAAKSYVKLWRHLSVKGPITPTQFRTRKINVSEVRTLYEGLRTRVVLPKYNIFVKIIKETLFDFLLILLEAYIYRR